jgi:hypothetical protein
VHAQLLDLAGQLRSRVSSLLGTADHIEAEGDRKQMRTGLLKLEGIIELMGEIADYEFFNVVRPSHGNQP